MKMYTQRSLHYSDAIMLLRYITTAPVRLTVWIDWPVGVV